MTQLINMKPHCVGRYLIDMPDGTKIRGSTTVQGVDIEAQAMSRAEYQHQLDERAAALKAIKSRFKFLYADGEVLGKDTRYFISLGDPEELSDGPRVIEAYKWDRGYRIKLQVRASDWTNSIYKDEPLYKNDPEKTDVPQKSRLVFGLLEKVRGRAEDEIPNEPGTCFVGGYLPGNAQASERIDANFLLAEYPNVGITFSTDTDIQESTTLLQRDDQIVKAVHQMHGGKTLRKGTVDLSGWKVEEWLLDTPTSSGGRGKIFYLEGNSTTGSAQAPYVALELRQEDSAMAMKDKAAPASLSESQALALWDAVSRTLRPGPSGF